MAASIATDVGIPPVGCLERLACAEDRDAAMKFWVTFYLHATAQGTRGERLGASVLYVCGSYFTLRVRGLHGFSVGNARHLRLQCIATLANYLVDLRAADRATEGLDMQFDLLTAAARVAAVPLGTKRRQDGSASATALASGGPMLDVKPQQVERRVLAPPLDLALVDPDDHGIVEGLVTDIYNMETPMPVVRVLVACNERGEYALYFCGAPLLRFAFVRHVQQTYSMAFEIVTRIFSARTLADSLVADGGDAETVGAFAEAVCRDSADGHCGCIVVRVHGARERA